MDAAQLKSAFSPEIRGVFDIASRLADERHQKLALVGGVVRDVLLGVPAGDVDIVIEPPVKPLVTRLTEIVNGELMSHERFFTFTVTLPSKTKIDVVTAREETYAGPAKLPDVTPATIDIDLKRRDFTINAIACSLNAASYGDLLDPFKGQTDLVKKIVRALHAKSFIDDPTRIFRAARFAGRLGFKVEAKTEAWIKESIDKKIPELLTPVRRRHEFELILKEKDPLPILKVLNQWNAVRLIHPSFKGLDSIKFGPSDDLPLRLAAWFKPMGKEKAGEVLTDLAFEKSIKVQILSKLVQSPTKP